MILESADLKNAKMRQTVVFAVNLRGADLRGCTLERSHFSRSDLSGADLRGADFRSAVFNEGTTFEGCIVDETTLFDDASIFRPLSRQEAFRFYYVDRGKLIRRPPQTIQEQSEVTPNSVSQDPELAAIRTEAVSRIDTALSNLSRISIEEEGRVPPAGIGHNNPPSELPIDRRELTDTIEILRNLRAEISKERPVEEIIQDSSGKLAETTKKILLWAGRKIDLAADEFMKSAGKSLGNASIILTTWLTISGQIGSVVETLGTLLSRLFH